MKRKPLVIVSPLREVLIWNFKLRRWEDAPEHLKHLARKP